MVSLLKSHIVLGSNVSMDGKSVKESHSLGKQCKYGWQVCLKSHIVSGSNVSMDGKSV